jgi:hypothetical protein
MEFVLQRGTKRDVNLSSGLIFFVAFGLWIYISILLLLVTQAFYHVKRELVEAPEKGL